jgi:hypothetical protein
MIVVPGKTAAWGERQMNQIEISLSTVLAWVIASVAAIIVLCIGFGVLSPRWGLTGGFLIALSHGIVMHHWLNAMKEREQRAYELGRESVHVVR